MKRGKIFNKRGQTRKFSLCTFPKKNRKGALEISFAWLFAIIVGIFILALAIYFSVKFIGTEQTSIDAKTGKEIGVLLNPLETSFETAKTTFFTVPVETRIYNICNDGGTFGKQTIQISQKSFNKWTETNVDVSFSNKYIFSDIYTEGKKFYVFSKPFEFPFKVADLIYITSSLKEYCFISPPENIEDEISDLSQENLRAENCSESSIKICFSNEPDCSIYVDYKQGRIKKGEKSVNFEGDSLMYAGIFADKEVYECQLDRLVKRIRQLSVIYKNKADFISKQGCNSDLNLIALSSSADSFSSSADLGLLSLIAEEIREENEANEGCRLW